MALPQAQAGEDELLVAAAQDSNPKLVGESSYGPDDMTCAICLEQIQLENTAYVKGCEHAYCGQCSLIYLGIFAAFLCFKSLTCTAFVLKLPLAASAVVLRKIQLH